MLPGREDAEGSTECARGSDDGALADDAKVFQSDFFRMNCMKVGPPVPAYCLWVLLAGHISVTGALDRAPGLWLLVSLSCCPICRYSAKCVLRLRSPMHVVALEVGALL